MDVVTVELPAVLLRAANLDTSNASADTARLLALELFREEKVSLSRAAELCATPLSLFMDFVAAHNVSPIRYSEIELEKDRPALIEFGL